MKSKPDTGVFRAADVAATPTGVAATGRLWARARPCAIVACAVAVLALAPAFAEAGTTDVVVRIEGHAETRFEGPVLSSGHPVRAASEAEAHPCEGPGRGAPPAPTPTASAVDAMALFGGRFDGRWYAGYGDFLVTEWAGEREAEGQSWSVFTNGALLDVGGCQFELLEGDEVLWSYGPPTARPLLALYPAGAPEGAPPLTALAALDAPYVVEVTSSEPKGGGTPPAHPGRAGSTAYAGADIVPVQTAADGAERPLGEDVLAVSGPEGRATVTFSSSGWHRLKAIASGAVRSNRLDVCVPAPGASGCGEPPAEDLPRPGSGAAPGGAQPPAVGSAGPAPSAVAPLDAGSSPGPARTAEPTLLFAGRPLPALAARSPALRYRGRWRARPSDAALDGTVMVGGPGAVVGFTLPAGRPIVAFAQISAVLRVEVTEAGRRWRLSLRRSAHEGHPRLLALPRRRRGGPVTLRVLSGRAALDGVALAP